MRAFDFYIAQVTSLLGDQYDHCKIDQTEFILLI